jgi:hypothetical protein
MLNARSPFNEADREMQCVVKQREEGRDRRVQAVSASRTFLQFNQQYKGLEDSNLRQ